MDLRQIEYLVAIDENGTFTRAAAKLHVSQPALSHAIRHLEHELGAELFIRLSRSVVATAAGRQVIEAARHVVKNMAEVRAAAAAVTTLVTGTLEISALPTLAVDPLAVILGCFRRDHDGVTVRVHEPETTAEIETSIRSGKTELGFTDLTTGARNLERVALSRQDIVAVSPGHDCRSTDPLTPRALSDLPLIVTPIGTSTRRLLDQTLSRSGLEPNIAIEIGHREAIIPLVLAGAGSSLLPRPLAREAARRGAVVRELEPSVTRRIGIIHRRSRLSPAAQAMLDLSRATTCTTQSHRS